MQFIELSRQGCLFAIGGVQRFALLLQQAFQRASFLLLALFQRFQLLLQRLIGGDELLRLSMCMVIAAGSQSDNQHDRDRAQHRAGIFTFTLFSVWLLGALNRRGWFFNRGGWGILFRHSGTSHSQVCCSARISASLSAVSATRIVLQPNSWARVARRSLTTTRQQRNSHEER
ncbi:hypothetical protein D3C72_1551020 [compost metagenome]